MVRLIAVCVVVTFVFVLSLPVIQISAFFNAQNSASPVSSDLLQEASNNPSEGDPFDAFLSPEERLNEIAPAAGLPGGAEQDAGFGDQYFYSNEHPSFLDHQAGEDSGKTISEIDL